MSCDFCEGKELPTASECPTCITLKIVGICEDCGQPYERLEPKNAKELRCIPCQVQFRITGKSGHERQYEAYKAQLRANQ
jgi:hypothetical protein